MRIKRIHHVTIAVRDLDGARLTFEQLFGASAGAAAVVDAFGVRAVDVPVGDGTLQLVSPTAGDAPVMRFLERKGEGFYNLAIEIEGLDEAVRQLSEQGVRVSEPLELESGVRSAFVTMAATHGVSVQLIEVTAAGGSSGQRVSESSDHHAGDAAIGDQPFARPANDPPLPEESAPEPERELLDLTPDEWSDVD